MAPPDGWCCMLCNLLKGCRVRSLSAAHFIADHAPNDTATHRANGTPAREDGACNCTDCSPCHGVSVAGGHASAASQCEQECKANWPLNGSELCVHRVDSNALIRDAAKVLTTMARWAPRRMGMCIHSFRLCLGDTRRNTCHTLFTWMAPARGARHGALAHQRLAVDAIQQSIAGYKSWAGIAGQTIKLTSAIYQHENQVMKRRQGKVFLVGSVGSTLASRTAW